MSIYSSTFEVGTADEYDGDHEDFGVNTGNVLVRCTGGCNHYPTPGETCERGSINGALIPGYCVRGHDDGDWLPVGGWYRLMFDAPNAQAQMLLDEDAVRALHADLTQWLGYAKVAPK